MEKQPLISILTPFKNTEAYLDDCINSIRQQTYQNWELLIVNDHSTDQSNAIVTSFAKQDSRIKLFQNKKKGIINALQLAFSKSKGTFISRMDSDDIMAVNKLEVLSTNLLKSGPSYIAVGLVRYFCETVIKNGFKRYETWLNTLTRKGSNFSELYKECVIPSPCWMVYRDDLLKCDAFNPNRYPEDYDLTFRFYKQGFKIIPCDEELHLWRDYNSRTSRTHRHYAQNSFITIKMHYFLQLNYNKKRPLILWGAGDKGKRIAKQLIRANIPFNWVCNNPKKIGKFIYKQPLLPFNRLEHFKNPQSIIAVANPQAQIQIKHYFKEKEMKPMADYFFFC